MNTRGLSLDQAPRLAVPAGFFLLVPLGMGAAGLLLALQGAALLSTAWSPHTMALTHLGTLGVLGAAMFGALYQMCPVVAGAPVPGSRWALAVQPLFALGVATLVLGLLGHPALLPVALGALGSSVLCFALPVGWALARAPGGGETVQGMRGAVLALLGVAGLGLVLAAGHAGLAPSTDRAVTLRLHLVLGLLGWVGGLLTAVSWQVLPMFYLARPVADRPRRLVLGGALTLLLVPWVGLATGSATHVALGASAGVLAVWVLHPVLALRALHQRRRRRSDASLRAWQAGLVLGLTCALVAWPAHAWPDPRWSLLLGWLAIAGWAGLIVHGMLSRILAFLVWFHRFSALAGLQPVPSMRELLPDRTVKVGLVLHGGAVLCGVVAIATRSDVAARAAGALLVLTALWVAAWSVRVLARRPQTLDR